MTLLYQYNNNIIFYNYRRVFGVFFVAYRGNDCLSAEFK